MSHDVNSFDMAQETAQRATAIQGSAPLQVMVHSCTPLDQDPAIQDARDCNVAEILTKSNVRLLSQNLSTVKKSKVVSRCKRRNESGVDDEKPQIILSITGSADDGAEIQHRKGHMEPVINIGYTLADASQHTNLSICGERSNVFRSTMEDEILRNSFLATNHEANIMSELTRMIGSVTKHDSGGS